MRSDGCEPEWPRRVDAEALLVALVLVPGSYPRNRFFSLYRSVEARRARRRAVLIRGVIGELLGDASAVSVERDGADVVLCYRLERVGVRRSTRLSASEHALVVSTLSRARPDASRRQAIAPLAASVPAEADRRMRELVSRLYHRQAS